MSKNPNGGLALLDVLVQLANILTTLQTCAGFHGVAYGAWLCQDDTCQCMLHTSLMRAHHELVPQQLTGQPAALVNWPHDGCIYLLLACRFLLVAAS